MKLSPGHLIALAFLLTVASGFAGGCAIERVKWEAKQQQAEQEILRLQSQTAKLDTVFLRDTLTLTQQVTRWKTLRDTLVLSDTVKVPGPVVREIVRVADSTVNACTAVLHDCVALRASLTHQRDSLTTVLARSRKPKAKLGCVVGATYTVGDLVDHRGLTDWSNRAGVTCGWRVF